MSTGQSQVTGGYADNRGSTFQRRIEYVVTKEKIDQAMKGITYNRHDREAKIRNEQRAQDQVCQEWRPFPEKMKENKVKTRNETKERVY